MLCDVWFMSLLCVLQADAATLKQVDLVRMTENTKRNLEQEVSSYRCAFVSMQHVLHGTGKQVFFAMQQSAW